MEINPELSSMDSYELYDLLNEVVDILVTRKENGKLWDTVNLCLELVSTISADNNFLLELFSLYSDFLFDEQYIKHSIKKLKDIVGDSPYLQGLLCGTLQYEFGKKLLSLIPHDKY